MSQERSSTMSSMTLTGRTWVAFGPVGAVGSIHTIEGGFTIKLLNDADFRGHYATLDAAKGAVMAAMPSGSERPEFREH
jgi:hypothetical protein